MALHCGIVPSLGDQRDCRVNSLGYEVVAMLCAIQDVARWWP